MLDGAYRMLRPLEARYHGKEMENGQVTLKPRSIRPIFRS